MKIYIENSYGIEGTKAYFRKEGDSCFSFSNSIKFASELSAKEVARIIEYADWYKNQYNANKMGVIVE